MEIYENEKGELSNLIRYIYSLDKIYWGQKWNKNQPFYFQVKIFGEKNPMIQKKKKVKTHRLNYHVRLLGVKIEYE